MVPHHPQRRQKPDERPSQKYAAHDGPEPIRHHAAFQAPIAGAISHLWPCQRGGGA
jgi:hypothetical protein